MKNLTLLFAVIILALTINLTSSIAGDEHDHNHNHEKHSEEDHEGHEHDNHDDHNDHDEHGDHHGHDDHGDHHDEMKTEIHDEAVIKSGVKTSIAESGEISDEVKFTGRVILNKNTTTNVGARFPGVVKKVSANWGNKVSAGEDLATVESNESLKTYKIKSPIEGYVLERHVSVGDVVENKHLFTIADTSVIWAKFHIFPKDISKINKGDRVVINKITDNVSTESKIDLIFPTADELSQTIVAIAEIENKDGSWKPGIIIEGIVQIDPVQAEIVVPNTAIQEMEGKQVVFVKDGEEYEATEIKLGKQNSHHSEILAGLDSGQEYVSEGSFIIKADIMKSAAGHDHAH